MAEGMLEGRRILVTGVATKRSIAFAVAREAQLAGAEVVLSSFGRMRRITERAAGSLPRQVGPVLELDVTRTEDAAAAAEQLQDGGLDGVLHAVAFAPQDAIGDFLATPYESAAKAFEVSAFSLKTLARELAPLLERSDSGSVVGLDFDATVAWPGYDWMGVAKAALESVNRYLAAGLGSRQVRVNLIAAGPLNTEAASSIPGFKQLGEAWTRAAPLGWDATDATLVANAACWLLSNLSRGITGEIVHVDGGVHACGVMPPEA